MVPAVVSALVELALPLECAGCGAPGSSLCPTCRPVRARPAQITGVRVYCGGDYDGALRAAVLSYKERGRRDLARALAEVVADAVAELLSSVECPRAALIPVPSTAAAVRTRGFSHVHRLARRAGARAGCPAVPALQLGRRVADSAGLTATARAANLAYAMQALPPAAPLPAVVVDDVATSGATLREAVRALEQTGWSVLGAAVVAATPRRYPARKDSAFPS